MTPGPDLHEGLVAAVRSWLSQIALGEGELAGLVGSAAGGWLMLEVGSADAWFKVVAGAARAPLPEGVSLGVTSNFTTLAFGQPRQIRWHFEHRGGRVFILPEELAAWERLMGATTLELFGKPLTLPAG